MAKTALTRDTFDATTNAPGIVLVDCWASRCPACRDFAPVFARVAERHCGARVRHGRMSTAVASWIALLSTCAAVLAVDPAPPPADTWPQWRGPTRDGQYAGPAWPDRLGSRLHLLWRVEMGPGYSGPIVTGDRVFTVETAEHTTETVRALDRKTGREIWRTTWPGAMEVPFFAAKNGSWVRATPDCDDDGLYVAVMRDVLVCLDAQTGGERWRVDFMQRFGTPLPSFGFVSSPMDIASWRWIRRGCSIFSTRTRSSSRSWTRCA